MTAHLADYVSPPPSDMKQFDRAYREEHLP